MSWKDPWKDEQGSKGGSKSRIPFGRHADTSDTFGADENVIGNGQLELILEVRCTQAAQARFISLLV